MEKYLIDRYKSIRATRMVFSITEVLCIIGAYETSGIIRGLFACIALLQFIMLAIWEERYESIKQVRNGKRKKLLMLIVPAITLGMYIGTEIEALKYITIGIMILYIAIIVGGYIIESHNID